MPPLQEAARLCHAACGLFPSLRLSTKEGKGEKEKGKGIVIMERNTMKYKVKQYLMFAGVSTVLFCAVVILPFIYGLYLTFTSWDGVSKEKPFVGRHLAVH